MKKVWEFKDARAQKLHKSVFDNVIIMDLQPFNIVNKPGFIRHMAIMEPRFQLGSDFYYRYVMPLNLIFRPGLINDSKFLGHFWTPLMKRLRQNFETKSNLINQNVAQCLWMPGVLFTMDIWE